MIGLPLHKRLGTLCLLSEEDSLDRESATRALCHTEMAALYIFSLSLIIPTLSCLAGNHECDGVLHACRDVALLLDESWGAHARPANEEQSEAGPSSLHNHSEEGPSGLGTT